MVKRKKTDGRNENGPGKCAWVYYFKSESKKMKGEGSKITNEVKLQISTNWKNLTAEEKKEFVNNYNKEDQYGWSSESMGDKPAEKSVDIPSDFRGITRCGAMRFSKIVSTFSVEQKDAVRELGFGSLLGMSCGRLRHDLCRYLVNQCNVERWSITLHGREYFLSSATFTSVMGVVDGGTEVEIIGDEFEIAELRAKYCMGKKGIPIANVVQMLQNITTADDDFRILFCLLVIGTVLCPTPATYIQPSYLHALKDVNTISSKNWATWCFNFLWDGVKKFKEDGVASLSGCVLFLMLFYMSSTTYKLPSLRYCCPVTAWTDKDIKKFIKWQQNLGGFETSKVPMRKDSQRQGSAAAELTMDSISFQPLETVVQRMEDLIDKNSKLLEKKIDCLGEKLSERIGKVELEIVEFKKYVRREQTDEKTSTRVHKDAWPSAANVVSSRQPDSHDPTPPAITLSSLVREKCGNVAKAIETEEDSALHSSSSKEDEIQQQRLKGILKDTTINPKTVPHLIDEHTPDVEGNLEGGQESDMYLVPVPPKRNKNPGRYQMYPYERVSKLSTAKFRAGPFVVKESVTVDQLRLIQYAFRKDFDHTETLVRTTHAHATRGGILSLLPNQEVQSEVICMIADLLTRQELLKRLDQQINCFLPSKFAQLVLNPLAHHDGFKKASQFRKYYLFDLHRCQRIYIPVNDGDCHWFLLVVKLKENKVEIWDPLPGARYNRSREQQSIVLLEALDEAVGDAVPSSFLKFDLSRPDGVPHQNNGFDCGIYVIKFMDTPSIICNKTYVHESENVRAGLALQMLESPFNELHDKLLQLSKLDSTNVPTAIGKQPAIPSRRQVLRNTKARGKR